MPETSAVEEIKVEVAQTPKRKSAGDSEDRKKRKRQKKGLKEASKRITESDRTKESVFLEQSEDPEGARARKERKRDKRAAKAEAQRDRCAERTDNGKRTGEKAKAETIADTQDNSLAYTSHNDDPASRNSPKTPNDALDQHNDITTVDVIRKKKRKRTETSVSLSPT
jgi:hypothetical protein